MKILYTKFLNEYDPISATWEYNHSNVLLEFSELINAIYSERIERVAVEILCKHISFYKLNGSLDFSVPCPGMDKYQYRGLNKNNHSRTGISLLFHPTERSIGNEWQDMEQYEMEFNSPNLVGKYLGIYR